MRSQATLRLPDGSLVAVGHGDTLGRLWNSAVVLDDPRVSEAHALVSLRGHELKLLGLRGRFAVAGKVVSELVLREGLQIELAEGLAVEVVDVELPDEVLGLEAEGLPTRVLPGTCGLVVQPTVAVVPPSDPAAAAHVWCGPDGWRLREVGGETLALEPDVSVQVRGCVVTPRLVSLKPSPTATTPDLTLTAPLRIVTRYDTVHIHREGLPIAVLVGLPARVISELVAFGAPVPWAMLCAELWPDGGSRKQLDMALTRLRRKLRERRVRSDLVRADGAGVIELLLQAGDQVEEQA